MQLCIVLKSNIAKFWTKFLSYSNIIYKRIQIYQEEK